MALSCYPAWLFWYDIQKRSYLMGKKTLHLLLFSQGRTSRNYSKREAALALLQLSSDFPVAEFQIQSIPPIQLV